MRNHPHDGACSPAGRGPTRRRPRGFTLLELTVALGVFVVFAVALTSVTTSSLNTQAQLRARSNATGALERAVDQVIAATGFAGLSQGVLLIPYDQRSVCLDDQGEPLPDADCPLPARQRERLQECIDRIDDPRQGCVPSGPSVLLVTYSVDEPRRAPVLRQSQMLEPYLEPYTVQVYAFASLPNGAQMTVTRSAGTPAAASGSAFGYIRVVLSSIPDDLFFQAPLTNGNTTLFTPRVRLVDDQGAEVVDWVGLVSDTLVLRVASPDTRCPRSAPCRVELDGGRYSLSDRYEARGGNQVVLSAGRVVPVTLQLTSGPSLLIRLDTLPERAADLRGAPERGSVCLWGTFDVPAGEDVDGKPIVVRQAEAWCNNTTATGVLVRGWRDGDDERDLPEGFLTLWANPPYEEVFDQQGATITARDCEIASLDGAVVWDGTDWQEGTTCTGWTWGQPGLLAESVLQDRRPFAEGVTSVKLTPSLRRELTLYWTSQSGAPAAGCSAEDPSWAAPRKADDRPATWQPEQQNAGSCGG